MRPIIFSAIGVFAIYGITAFTMWTAPIDFASMDGFSRFIYVIVSAYAGFFGFVFGGWSWK